MGRGGGHADQADLQRDADFLGLQVPVEADTDVCHVWYKNRRALSVFQACSSQWRLAIGMGGAICTGLDYAGVDVVIRRTVGPGRQNQVFQDLQLIERGALEVVNSGS